MAALALKKAPLLIRLPNGQIVPASGGALVTPDAPQPVAANLNDAGQMGPALVGPGAASPAAAQAEPAVALETGGRTGGAANPHTIDTYKPPPVMGQNTPGGDSSGADGLAMIKKLAAMAGKSDPLAPVEVTPQVAGTPGAPEPGGILDKLKSMFLGTDDNTPKTAATPAPAAAVAPADPAAPALEAPTPGPMVDNVPGPKPRPALVTDFPQTQVQPAALSVPGKDEITAAAGTAPTIPKPDFMTRLRNNPLALALVTGGLQTMVAGGRPGATLLGSLGEGGIAGLSGAFGEEASQREEAMAERKAALDASREASENALRIKQGVYYDTRGDAALTTAGANDKKAEAAGVTAGANVTKAEASTVSAAAAKLRAENYAKNGPYGAGKQSVFQQKQSAWLAVPGQENDQKGALDYASGQKKLTGGDRLRSAYALANSEYNAMVTPPPEGTAWVDKRAAEISDKIGANDLAKAAPETALGGAAPAPKPATPAPQKPQGNGTALGQQGGPPPPPPKPGALEAQAKAAIAKGADPAKVKDRLKKLGGNPGAL